MPQVRGKTKCCRSFGRLKGASGRYRHHGIEPGRSGRRPPAKIRRIPVTLVTLPQSMIYTSALWDAALFAGGTAPAVGLSSGREREGGRLQQACNRLATCLQLACNYGGTPALRRCCPAAARGFRARPSCRKAARLRCRGSVPRGGIGRIRLLVTDGGSPCDPIYAEPGL